MTSTKISNSSERAWRVGTSFKGSLTPTHLEYLPNFLGPIGWKEHKQRTPNGTTVEICNKKEKSATDFMTFLQDGMDQGKGRNDSKWAHRKDSGASWQMWLPHWCREGITHTIQSGTCSQQHRHSQETACNENESNYSQDIAFILCTHFHSKQYVIDGPGHQYNECHTKGTKEGIMCKLWHVSCSRLATLPGKCCQMQLLPYHRALESQMQEVQKDIPRC